MFDFRKKKIIIADDSQTFLIYLSILLKRMGFTVIPAENGPEVLKLLKLVKPDVVLLDIYMGEMDGLALLRCMKEDKETSGIPVVMVSVDSNPATVEKCSSLGCAGYLTKPVKLNKLNDVLEELIFSGGGTKRKHLRVSVNRKVRVTYNGASMDLYSESLSEGGIYIRKKDPCPVGSDVEVAFPLKDGDTLGLRGVVIYTKDLFGEEFMVPPGMAVKFSGITDAQRAALKDHIDHLIAGDILDSQEEDVIEP